MEAGSSQCCKAGEEASVEAGEFQAGSKEKLFPQEDGHGQAVGRGPRGALPSHWRFQDPAE